MNTVHGYGNDTVVNDGTSKINYIPDNEYNIQTQYKLGLIENMLAQLIQKQIVLDKKCDLILEQLKGVQNVQNAFLNDINTLKNNQPDPELQAEINENCKKMGHHINFIENVYSTVKSPLNFLTNKINYMIGSDANVKQLPDIEMNSCDVEREHDYKQSFKIPMDKQTTD